MVELTKEELLQLITALENQKEAVLKLPEEYFTEEKLILFRKIMALTTDAELEEFSFIKNKEEIIKLHDESIEGLREEIKELEND